MNIQEMYDEIFLTATKINDFWANKKFSSKAIRKEVIYSFFYDKKANFYTKLAYFFALDNRIKERYNNILKIIFRYFAWRQEKKLLSKIKAYLKCPDSLDAKTIILKKSQDKLNGEDCFGSNGKLDGGRSLHNKMQKEQSLSVTQNTQDLKTDVDIQKVNVDEEEQVLDDEKSEISKDRKTLDRTIEYEKPNDYALQKNIPKYDAKLDADKSHESLSIRENIEVEVPKSDLIKLGGLAMPQKDNSCESAKLEKIESALQQLTPTLCDKINNTPEKQEKIFADNKAKENDFVYYDKAQKNLLDKPAIQEHNRTTKDEFLANDYTAKSSEHAQSYEISERQKSIIASEEISKISEKDMQAIKDIMQQELDNQMRIAEEKGEVYKMPLSIQEAIEHKPTEKSPVQEGRVHSSVLKNKK